MTCYCQTKIDSNMVATATAILTLVFASICGGAEAATSVTTADGGSIQTKLTHSIVLNRESSMRREWVAVHDDSMAVDLVDTPGVNTIYESGKYRGDYRYNANYSIVVHEPVVAVEIRFITFDVWGNRTRSLSATDIRDFKPGRYQLDAVWNLFSENEASEHYASIAYVAMVRTKAGEIQYADTEAVTEVARQYMSGFTSDLLNEEPPRNNQGN